MNRRTLMIGAAALVLTPTRGRSEPLSNGRKLLAAAERQKGVTRNYDGHYVKLAYPGGDVPRATGVCADVIVRAARDGLSLDLQKLVHEDMTRDFAAYPNRWRLAKPDANIDHRRVPNLETYWRRQGCELWRAKGAVWNNGFPLPIQPGDILTFAGWAGGPHVAIVVHGPPVVRVIHNIGFGVNEVPLWELLTLKANGHYRWPKA